MRTIDMLDALLRDGICTNTPATDRHGWTRMPGRSREENTQVAQGLCQGCPVIELCAAYAEAIGATDGIFAGLAPHDLPAPRRRSIDLAYQRGATLTRERRRTCTEPRT